MNYQDSFICVKCKQNHFVQGRCQKCFFDTCECCRDWFKNL